MSDQTTPRITTALAACQEADTDLMAAAERTRRMTGKDPDHMFALAPLRLSRAAAALMDAVEAELPELLARLAAGDAVVEAVRIYHQAAPGSDVWDTYDRLVGDALAAYDAFTATASTPDAAGEGVGG